MNDDASTRVSAGELLDVELVIETPERVQLRYELAGIGSRAAAGSFDACILLVVLFVAFMATLIFVPAFVEHLDGMGGQVAFLAITGVVKAVVAAYYLLLEPIMGGQTPGKRLLRLRVVGVDGSTAPVGSLLVRNLVRVVDALPTFHLLGGLVMFLTPRGQRLGDIAAGTVVVRERRQSTVLMRLGDDQLELGERLPAAEIELVRSFLRRRGELRPSRREAIGAELVARIEARTGELRLPPLDLLRHVATGTTLAELRAMAAPQSEEPEA